MGNVMFYDANDKIEFINSSSFVITDIDDVICLWHKKKNGTVSTWNEVLSPYLTFTSQHLFMSHMICNQERRESLGPANTTPNRVDIWQLPNSLTVEKVDN